MEISFKDSEIHEVILSEKRIIKTSPLISVNREWTDKDKFDIWLVVVKKK